MSAESQLVIAMLTVLTITWIGVFAYVGARLNDISKEIAVFREKVASFEALRQELCENAKHNVRQIWQRLDDEDRRLIRKYLLQYGGINPPEVNT
jgi:hypothetical protein